MRDRTDDSTQDRHDSHPSEHDAWWLSRGRTPTRPSSDAEPASVPDEEVVEPVPLIEDHVPADPGDEDEIVLDEPDVEATWFSLEETITLRADEARACIAGIATSGAPHSR